MNKDAAIVHEKCQNCQLSMDKEESYVVFFVENWRTLFIEYLTQGILLADRKLAHQLKKLVVRYFIQNEILFKKGYNKDPLRCLRPREAREVANGIHSGEYVSHPRKRRLYKQLLQLGYYWPIMKKRF